MSPLGDAQLKLKRSQQFLDELRAQTDDFAFQLAEFISGDGLRHEFKLFLEQPVDENWGIIAGDCVHNMRAALDLAAFALVRANNPTMTPQLERMSMFPVLLDSAKLKDHKGFLRALSTEARQLVEAEQPYNSPKPEEHRLWTIHHLDRVDKHRHLNVTAVAIPSVVLNPLDPVVKDQRFHFGGIIDRSATWAEIEFHQPFHGSYATVQPSIVLCINDATVKTEWITHALARLKAYADDLVGRLESLLP